MRPIILALVPVILFVGALLSAGSPPAASDAPQHAAYKPAVDTSAPAQPAQEVQPAEQPAPPAKPEAAPQQPPAPKPVVYAQVTRCSDGATTAYEYNGTTQIQPLRSKAAQCADPLVVVKDGVRYFGCVGGKIILDCDWFAERIGQENQGSSAVFGSSSLEDFSAPDISGFSCADASVEADLLLTPQGKICDLQTLVGNVGQAGG